MVNNVKETRFYLFFGRFLETALMSIFLKEPAFQKIGQEYQEKYDCDQMYFRRIF